jgi:hypothetical protein
MALMTIGAAEVLLSVTLCVALVVPIVWEAKVKDVGEKVGGNTIPLPKTFSGPSGVVLLVLMLREPLRCPSTVGVKITEIVQLRPFANEVPQLFVWLKSPVTATLEMESAKSPEFVNTTFWAGLVVFSAWSAKVTVAGDTLPCSA